MIINLSSYELSQILAAIAFITGVIGFQCRELRNILICFSLCSFISALHFELLSARTAAAILTISGTRHLTAIFTKNLIALITFLVLVQITTFLTYEHPVNLLVTVAASLGTIGSFSKDAYRARKLWMMTSFLYITHNIIVHTPVATLMESFFLCSNLIAYYRIKRISS